jgi:hypothetical protein
MDNRVILLTSGLGVTDSHGLEIKDVYILTSMLPIQQGVSGHKLSSLYLRGIQLKSQWDTD